MNHEEGNSRPAWRYAGRVRVDSQGSIVPVDGPPPIAPGDSIPAGIVYAKIEIWALGGQSGPPGSGYVDLRSTDAFRLLRASIFTDDVTALEWLLSPAPALGGAIPAERLHTEEGRRELESVILGIAHGNFL
jgi:hypothetical protein